MRSFNLSYETMCLKDNKHCKNAALTFFIFVRTYCHSKIHKNNTFEWASAKHIHILQNCNWEIWKFIYIILEFNIPPTAVVIRRRVTDDFHPTDWKSLGSNSGPLGTRQVAYPLITTRWPLDRYGNSSRPYWIFQKQGFYDILNSGYKRWTKCDCPFVYISFFVWYMHWRSSHYAVTHMPNKKSNIQGRSPYVVQMKFHAIRNCS